MWKKCIRKWYYIRPRTKFTVLATIIIIPIIYYLFKYKIICSNWQIHHHVASVCKDYQNGQAHGDMCPDLCRGKVIPLACQTFHSGKEIVFEAEWNGRHIFVKSIAVSETDTVYWVDSNGNHHYPSYFEFEDMLRTVIAENVNATSKGSPIEILWPYVVDKHTMNTVWALAQSSEYVLAKFFQRLNMFPGIVGTCGPYYAEERLLPVFEMSKDDGSFESWAKRVKAAKDILDFLHEARHVFSEPMHLCDVKLEHFGIDADRKVRFLDLDSVYLKSNLERLLADGSTCEKNSDCDYFSCKSKCFVTTGKCSSTVANNNYQSVCQRIFLGVHENKFLAPTGLLVSPYATEKLNKLLEMCSYPNGITSDLQRETPLETVQELYAVLEDILQFATVIK